LLTGPNERSALMSVVAQLNARLALLVLIIDSFRGNVSHNDVFRSSRE